MEKEQILSTITERLKAEGQTSLSQRTLGDYINDNLPSEGTEPDEAYWERHTKFLKSLSVNFSNDMAAAVNDFKTNYKPQTGQQPPNQDPPQPNKEVEDLKMQLADLTKRLDERESKLTQEQLMSQVMAEMKKQGATDEYVLKQTLRGVTLDTKKSVTDLAKEMLTAYNSELTACRGKGAAPRNGGEGGGGSKGKNAADSYFARKQKKEGWGKQPEK